MAEAKTKPTTQTAESFIEGIAEEGIRKDCYKLIELMQSATGEPPVMWGPAIVGFDSYHFKYESGREGDICLIGFSPRKANLTLYILSDFEGHEQVVANLGKHTTGKSCLYIKKLTDVNIAVLEELISRSVAYLRKKRKC